MDRRDAVPARAQLLHAAAGPEAQQLAIYIGWLLHKTKGGLVAGTLFVLPGFVVHHGAELDLRPLGNVGVVQGLFFGLKAAVLAIVLEAVVRIGKRAAQEQRHDRRSRRRASSRSSFSRCRSPSSSWPRASSASSAAIWARGVPRRRRARQDRRSPGRRRRQRARRGIAGARAPPGRLVDQDRARFF